MENAGYGYDESPAIGGCRGMKGTKVPNEVERREARTEDKLSGD